MSKKMRNYLQRGDYLHMPLPDAILQEDRWKTECIFHAISDKDDSLFLIWFLTEAIMNPI